MLDICDLIRFFSKCLKQVNPMAKIESSNSEDEKAEKKEINIFLPMVETLV